MARESKENKIIKDLSGFVFCNEDLRNSFVEMINLLGEINSGKRAFKADNKISYEEILKLLETAAINAKLENKKRPSFNKVEIGGIKPFPKFNFGAFAGKAGPSYCGITTVLDEYGNLFVDIPSVVKTLTEITTSNLDEKSIHTLNNVEQAKLSSTIEDLKEFITQVITQENERTREIIVEQSSITRAITIEEAERNRTLLSHEIAEVSHEISDLKYQIINISNQQENTDANKNKKEVIRLQNELSDMETRYSALIEDKKILEERYSQLSHDKEQLEKEQNKAEENNEKFYALGKQDKTNVARHYYVVSAIAIEIILALLGLAISIIWISIKDKVVLTNDTWEATFTILGSCYLILTVIAVVCIIKFEGSWILRGKNKIFLIGVLFAFAIVCVINILSQSHTIPKYLCWIGFVIWSLILIFNIIYFIASASNKYEHLGLIVLILIDVSILSAFVPTLLIGNKVYYDNQIREKFAEYEGISDDLLLYRTLEDGTLAVVVYRFDSEELVIPSQIDKKVVSAIESVTHYFYDNMNTVKKITIPNSVTNIGEYAFNNCSAEIVWEENPSIEEISASAFAGYAGTSITIPNSVTNIGEYAFNNCSAEIVWEENPSIEKISTYAFAGYTGTSITIPNTVKTIGESAFYNCRELTSIVIPDSVTQIGADVFSGCSNLCSITLPFIGSRAGVTEKDTYQYPLGYIFGTSSYTGGVATEQYYYRANTSSTAETTYYIPSSLKSVTVTGGNILRGAFYACDRLTSITIGENVLYMRSAAFLYCSSLQHLYFKNTNGWQVSENEDFFNYIELKDISDGVKYINDPSYYWRRVE